jgi:hypothetical protein
MFNVNYNYKIYTMKSGIYIADCIKYMLDSMNYNTTIVYNISREDINNNNNNPNEIYILLFCQTLKYIPLKNKYIIYQLEQVKQSKWINKLYLERIEYSLFTLDYSLYNYNFFKKNFEEKYYKKIYYFPIPIINEFIINKNIEINYDLLFFGTFNKRRTDICNILKDKYNILVVNNLFGNDLYKVIMKSKIILNIHFYKNAVLETARINDVLRFNKVIISEKSCDNDVMEFYNNIIYCDEINDNLSNINKLYELIDYYLIDNNYKTIIDNNNLFIKKIHDYSYDNLLKLLKN